MVRMSHQSSLAVVIGLMCVCIMAHATAESTHIYVDQATGHNTPTTGGTSADPFKSITYAFTTMNGRGATDPWTVCIAAGTYDADPAKDAEDREAFPVELRPGMVFSGINGPNGVVISGLYNADSPVSILHAQDANGIIIRDVTLSDMTKTPDNAAGAACELVNCTGLIDNCLFIQNAATGWVGHGGAVWLSISPSGSFDFRRNTFAHNTVGNAGGYGGAIFVSGSYTGSIEDNTFYANQIVLEYSGQGGAISVEGDFVGTLARNVFVENVSPGNYWGDGGAGGGISIGGAAQGTIRDNAFAANVSGTGGGGGLFAGGLFSGRISANIFTRNTASADGSNTLHGLGAGLHLAAVGGQPAAVVVAENFFFANSIGGTRNRPLGTGLSSRQNVIFMNNTLSGSPAGQSAVDIQGNASVSELVNNIFCDMHVAISEEAALELPTENNDFWTVVNIFDRAGVLMGSDIASIASTLASFQNNYDWAAGFDSGPVSGTWTNSPVFDMLTHQSTLTDSSADWQPGQWKGWLLDTPGGPGAFLILGNTSTTITVRGNLAVTGYVDQGDGYTLHSYRLASASRNIDAGLASPLLSARDFEGDPRVVGMAPDIGADEFASGEGGALVVTILPIGAVSAGGQWSLDGGVSWHDSDATVNNIAPGAAVVSFKPTVGWTATPQTVNIVAGQTVTVVGIYSPATYTLSTSVSGWHGSLVPVTGSHDANAMVVLTATPDYGYEVQTWTGTDNDASTAPTNTVTMTGDKTVTVQFALVTHPYTLTYTAAANGSITGASPQTVNYGTDGTAVAAVPNPHFRFAQWSDGLKTATRQDKNVMANVDVAASFLPEVTEIYVNQATGRNTETTAGTDADPFKSITYAFTTMAARNAPEPWTVHIGAGTYDADPLKAIDEREVFPIGLRPGMVFAGVNEPSHVLISGFFNVAGSVSILHAQDANGIIIRDVTLSDMTKTPDNAAGAACELVNCTGLIDNCLFIQNAATGWVGHGGAVWLSISPSGSFDFRRNTFAHNTVGNAGGYGGAIFVSGSYTGSIEDNTFYANQIVLEYSGQGGAISVEGDFVGTLARNVFVENVSPGNYWGDGGAGGGISIGGAAQGTIRDNAFAANVSGTGGGGGLFAGGLFSGRISANIFTRNTASADGSNTLHGLGAGLHLAAVGGQPAAVVVAENFFFANSIGGTRNRPLGTGLSSRQNVIFMNNTLSGSPAGQSAVDIQGNASVSELVNNIFCDMHVAISEEAALELPTENNDFWTVVNIFDRAGVLMGSDIASIASTLASFQNNYDWAAGFDSGPVSGTWTNSPVFDMLTHQSTLTDSSADWQPGQWKGWLLDTPGGPGAFLILGNTSTTITVRGNLAVTGYVDQGDGYTLHSYRLASASRNIDAGLASPLLSARDFEGDPRVSGSGVDIGADEYVSGENEGEGEVEGEVPVPHPGDINEDYRMILSEAIAYLAGWQQGSNPMAYAIRAAYLWQNGETYRYDNTSMPPLCWVLLP